MEKDFKFLLAFSQFPKFGPVKLGKIKNYFSSFEQAFLANVNDLQRAGIEEKIAQEFLEFKKSLKLEKILDKLEKENIKIVSLSNDDYPALLKEIYTPPFILYYKGSLESLNKPSLAVVGSRKFTYYGKQITDKIVYDLAMQNLTIVSGLALGIDSLAHNATLRANGQTVAVLGTGIDSGSIYPSSNKYLAEKIIAQNGAIISEFPLGTPPLKHHFPQRNRIISGLSLGTLVIEAGEKSGSLITAHCALEQNREVFAIPGNIYSPVSMGPNNLIKQGAKIVTNYQDILETLDLLNVNTYSKKEFNPSNSEEELIMACLTHEPIHINEIIRQAKIEPKLASSTLTILEIKGAVTNLGNMQYIKAS